jgi:hypothetical protein
LIVQGTQETEKVVNKRIATEKRVEKRGFNDEQKAVREEKEKASDTVDSRTHAKEERNHECATSWNRGINRGEIEQRSHGNHDSPAQWKEVNVGTASC